MSKPRFGRVGCSSIASKDGLLLLSRCSDMAEGYDGEDGVVDVEEVVGGGRQADLTILGLGCGLKAVRSLLELVMSKLPMSWLLLGVVKLPLVLIMTDLYQAPTSTSSRSYFLMNGCISSFLYLGLSL